MTPFDRIGADALRAVITDFYATVFDDVMIGFLFVGKDQATLIEREWEFTARLLGADVPYRGRPIRAAHAASPILGGHFERRAELLRQALARHQVDAEVQRVWLDHTEALRAQVTRDAGSACDAVTPEPPPADRPIRLGRRR